MKELSVSLQQKRIEQALSCIGAKIAHAAELSRQAKCLASTSDMLLRAAQQQLEDLHLCIGAAE